MGNHTYYRWLLSYMPIFIIIISGLILVSVLSMNEISKRQTEQANQIYARHVLDTIDTSLRLIEQVTVKELMTDEALAGFYRPQPSNVLLEYEASQRINALIITMPQIDSIYLYRYADQAVLTQEAMVPLSSFADRDFLLRHEQSPVAKPWTDQRVYKGFAADREKMVVSLVRNVPLIEGNRGVFVVNVSIHAINRMYLDYVGSDISEAELVDENGRLFFAPHHPTISERFPAVPFLSEHTSPYTGWTIYSGITSLPMLHFFSYVSWKWLFFGCLIVLLGILGMIWVTRGNYLPILAISNRVTSYAQRTGQTLGVRSRGELDFIESALDVIIERSNQFEVQHKEDLILRKRHFFHTLTEGETLIRPDEWSAEMARLSLPDRFSHAIVAIAEIDSYSQFAMHYNPRDQYLLKFALSNVISEQAALAGITGWCEWTAAEQLGIMFMAEEHLAEPELNHVVLNVCEAARTWIVTHLQFTVTFAIGDPVSEPGQLSLSYGAAQAALQYKSTLGNNRVIQSGQLPKSMEQSVFDQLQHVRTITEHYRLGEETWRELYLLWIASLQEASLSRDELINLFNYFSFQLYKEIGGLPQEFQQMWKKDAMRQFNDMLERFELLQDLADAWLAHLNEQWRSLQNYRENRKNHRLIHQVKDYIELHYQDSNLSLQQLSEVFSIHLKSLSRLFKEEFGETFIEYVTRVRMEQAARLLVESDLPVADIAVKMGYLQSNSFIRVFKKNMGVTPGDYRRQSRP
ncbi:AraC family transcriptional regulator [Paenibacillus sp. 1P07SE]|uniref:AraC family transcriptional regulator n=1 Tax=Paenibacillus sp. 1P07SE TaxID=3132209 RepID=UPI0039A40E89